MLQIIGSNPTGFALGREAAAESAGERAAT